MLKNSKICKDDFVYGNVATLFLHRLLELFDPRNQKKIFYDSLQAIEYILDPNDLFDLCISGLIDAMKNLTSDTDYSNYIQPILRSIHVHKNKERLESAIRKMKNLIKFKRTFNC